MSNVADTKDAQTVIDVTRAFWREMAREAVKNSAETINSTARELIAITAILEGLYFHAIASTDLQGQIISSIDIMIYLAPLIFWLFGLISASLVFLPREYRIDINSSEAGKELHEKVVPRKYTLLVISMVLLIVGGICLIPALAFSLGR